VLQVSKSPATDPRTGAATFRLELTWSIGSGAYRVSTAEDARFRQHVRTLESNYPDQCVSVLAKSTAQVEFFEITNMEAVSQAVTGLGYDPRPAPTTTGVSPTEVWWGDTFTVSGRYFDKDPESNTLTLFDRMLSAQSVTLGTDGYATAATFKVPEDARGGFLNVQVGSAVKDSELFLTLTPRGIPAVLGLRNIVYAPQTGHFWVASDGQIQELDLLRHDPTILTTISGVIKPNISRVSESGQFVYVDGVSGATTIYAVNVTTKAISVYAQTNDSGFTNPVLVRGIGLDPNGSAAFMADDSASLGGLIVKVPAGNTSAILQGFGGFHWFDFPDPCPVEVGFNHLVLTAQQGAAPWSTNYIAQCTQTNTYMQFTTEAPVHSLEVDRRVSNTTKTRFFWAFNNGMAHGYNLNTIEDPGGSIPPRFIGTEVYSYEVTGLTTSYKLTVEPARYAALPDQGARIAESVILSNFVPDQPYPSPNQSMDRIIRIELKGWAGVLHQVRLIDPPDRAPYAPKDSNGNPWGWDPTSPLVRPRVHPYEANDNRAWAGWIGPSSPDFGLAQDPAVPIGYLTLPALNPVSHDGTSVGTCPFFLKVPARFAGDNWQIEITRRDATTGQLITSQTPCLSQVFTGLKRVFIERDRMFRRGGVLARDASPGDTVVYLAKVFDAANSRWIRDDNVQLNERVALFDTMSPFEGPHDEACVAGLADETNDQVSAVTVLLGLPNCPGGNGLTRAYGTSVDAQGWTFAPGTRSAGLGVIASATGVPYNTARNQINTANSAFFDIDMRNVTSPFDEAYVEFVAPDAGAGAVPFISSTAFSRLQIAGRSRFSRLWFDHYQQQPGYDPPGDVPHNYFHMIAAAAYGDFTGLEQSFWDWAFVFQGTIENLVTDPTLRRNLQQTIASHEAAHMFDLNFCQTLACGPYPQHDERSWWRFNSPGCANPNACLMQPDGGIPSDAIQRFCLQDLFLGDPTSACQDADGVIYDSSNTSVRTAFDPK